MSTNKILQIESTSYENTCEHGENLARNFRGGEVINLQGDLGAGKTAFTTGMARGVGSSDVVGSPTFTLNKIYKGSKLTMYHFDFYRLHEPGLMSEQLQEVLEDKNSVVVVEWGDIVSAVLPAEQLQIKIKRDADDENKRIFTYNIPSNYKYTLEGIK